MVNIDNPLIDPPPQEVPLKNAPLVRVIAQMRFPPILSIEKKEFVSSFQEAIRENYPILRVEETQGFIVSPTGFVPTKPQTTWRFTDMHNHWRVSLAPNFLALETNTYLGRTNFLQRLENVVQALEESFHPRIIERFGLRYVNRLVSRDFQDVTFLIKPEIAGIIIAPQLKEFTRETINQSLFVLPNQGEQILARWGVISANTTFDPDALEAISENSWILDLDMSLAKNREFKVETLIKEATQYSERLYTFFRWTIQDEFLKRFGGEL